MNSTTSNHFPTANFSLRRYTSTTSLSLAYAYYRLSQEEAQDGQSSASIINQKKIVEAYCEESFFWIPLSMTVGQAATLNVPVFRK